MLAGLRFDKTPSKKKKQKGARDAERSPGRDDVKESDAKVCGEKEIASKPSEKRSLSPCRIVPREQSANDHGAARREGDGASRIPGSRSNSRPRDFEQERKTSFLDSSTHHGISPVAAARELNPFLRLPDASSTEKDADARTSPHPFAVLAPTADTWRSAQTWRARQLRRLQERAANMGDTTVARLLEEHVGDSGSLVPGFEVLPDTASSPPSSRPWSRRVRESSDSRGDRGRSSFRPDEERGNCCSPSSRRGEAHRETDTPLTRASGSRLPSASSGFAASHGRGGWRKQAWRESERFLESGLSEEGGSGDRQGDQRVTRFEFSRSREEKETNREESRGKRPALRSPPRPPSSALRTERSGASSSMPAHSLPAPRSREEALSPDNKTGLSDPLFLAGSRGEELTSESAKLDRGDASQVPPPALSAPTDPPSGRPPAPSASADMNNLAAQALRAHLLGDRAGSRRLEGLMASRQLSATNEELVRSEKTRAETCESGSAALPPWQRAAAWGRFAGHPAAEGEERGYPSDTAFDLRRERDAEHTNFDQVCVAAVLRNRMYDEDDDAAAPKVSEKKRRILEERDRMRGLRLNKQQGKCSRCIDTENFSRFHGAGVVSMATHAVVCFQPWRNCVLRSHLLIIPSAHVSSVTTLDDAGYEEIRNFQKSLVTYFKDARQEAPIFIETVSHFVSKEKLWMGAGPHTAVEVLPIPVDRLSEAKTYFRKAFEEAESEWQQHKKVIEVRGRDGIRAAIPANIPYIHVDFALTDGLAHVIDDGRSFSPSFGREVIQGMLELSPTDRAFPTEQAFKNTVASFRRDFSRFDWTATN
ncbi:cwfj family protein [Toxoplasma gondii GT1]|uniref:Cwfj family protein n=2 Tax=Toxoplasma gondii TaxID=5811 RepID=S7UQS5_TOXGG|nr:cwfj family protein [Toxoplasma gondii GT1]KAF4640285.1 cwfj family protein [Toxoplasma gondii]